MPRESPQLVILAGPNGSGKSTTAPELLRGTLGVKEFVNADDIARGLSAFDTDRVAIQSGRIMLGRLRELARQRVHFAFETTLSSRTLRSHILALRRDGYAVHLLFLWLPDADTAVHRVTERVRRGGHAVPVSTVRRRYLRGLRNFFSVYREAVDTWRLYDNSRDTGPSLVARGGRIEEVEVRDADLWKALLDAYGNG